MDYNPIANLVNPCEPVVQFVSSLACPALTVSKIWGYLAPYTQYMGVFFVGAGVMLAFFGYRLIGPTMCIVGFLTSVVVAGIFFWTIMASSSTQPKQLLTWLAAGGVIGIGVGCILCKNEKLGAEFLAGWGGAILGVMANDMFLYRLGYSWMTYAATIGGAAAAAWYATKYYEPLILLSTSLLGSYGIVRGASFYLGGWYNTMTVVNLVKSGMASSINQIYWCYVGAFFIIAFIGYKFQGK